MNDRFVSNQSWEARSDKFPKRIDSQTGFY